MTHKLARRILRSIPQCWSDESASIKEEYAKQLLENKLIEEIELGKFRATELGSYFADMQDDQWPEHTEEEMRLCCNFTWEEYDLIPRIRILTAKDTTGTFNADKFKQDSIGKLV